MERKKMYGIILFVVGLVFILLNVIVVYPFISCFYAPYAFWLLAIVGVTGGILLFFDINLFHSEEN
ncbi:MAG: hypothetical protein KGD72_02550 [Candidatus Lokiarchaeota archaeon]|nr:hypothetical protein [Candidatus Lokiarchaeota archaeon]